MDIRRRLVPMEMLRKLGLKCIPASSSFCHSTVSLQIYLRTDNLGLNLANLQFAWPYVFQEDLLTIR